MQNFLDYFFNYVMIPLGMLFVTGLLVYFIVRSIQYLFKIKNKKDLILENEELRKENERLHKMVQSMECASDNATGEENGNSFLKVGAVSVPVSRISYIVTQSFDKPSGGDPRVKVVHYADSDKTDSVYESFDRILSQLLDYFMMINKNQLVNLHEIIKVEGNSFQMNGQKEVFYVSETKLSLFNDIINKKK